MPSQGPNSPTSAVNDPQGGTVAWSTPGNVFASDNAYAAASTTSTDQVRTYNIKATGFGFTIPSDATIEGIVVEIERKASGSSTGTVRDASVRLYKAGVLTGADRAATATAWPTADAYKSYGGATDLWGTTWTPADINAAGFGVGLAATLLANGPLTVTAYVDHIRVTVYYSAGGSTIQSMTQII